MRSLLAFAMVGLVAGSVSAGPISGEYLEARNADVWTGPCFANGEIGIVGNKAILAWKVDQGEFEGVSLDGLAIAAVVIGDGTFGIGEQVRTRSVLVVDDKADAAQRDALIAMARELAGDTIQDVVRVESSPVVLSTAYCDGLGCARLEAGVAKVLTRCLCENDSICGHETISYPALARIEDEYAAYTIENEYRGDALGETFADSNARSAIIAKFVR